MSWVDKMEKLPDGYSEVMYKGRKYGVSRTAYNDGRSLKVYAEELGGKHFISFNYYSIAGSGILKPCEMPEQEVVDFLDSYCQIEK